MVLSLCFVMNHNNQPTAFALSFKSMRSLLWAISLLNLFSCSKVADTNPDNPPVNPQPNISVDLATKVKTSVIGFVSYRYFPDGMSGATVTIGNRTTLTDKYGYYEIRDVEVAKEAAFVTVTMPGYLKSIKTFVPSEGKTTFVRVGVFLPDSQVPFQAATGGGYYNSNVIDVVVPPNAMINKATKQPFTGEVMLTVRYVYRGPGESLFNLPGDSRGVDSLGAVKWLDSYGIVTMECRGMAGETLELAEGKSVRLNIGLLYGSASSAPPTAPMWYFDEEKGLWQQSGTAVKVANSYQANVSRLSSWNVAIPVNLVRFDFSLTDAANIPLPFTTVRLQEVGNDYSAILFSTDSTGHAAGFLPDGRQFIPRFFGGQALEPAGVAKAFRTAGTDVSLGNIIMPATNIATLTGTLLNCKGESVTNGYVLLERRARIKLTSAGQFSFRTLVAGDPVTDYVRIFTEDLATGQTGDAILDTLQVGTNNYGTISTCGTEFLENFSATLHDANGQPLQDVWVRVSNLSLPQNAPFTYLPSTTGVITGKLPRNTRFLLEVFSSESCSTPAFTQTFASVTTAVELGIVTVTGLQLATIHGTVSACNGQAATSGYILMKKGHKTLSVPLDAGGRFHFATPVCNGTTREAISLIGMSNATYTISSMIGVNLTAGDNNVGEIKACATPVNEGEFVHYILDGVTHAFVSPDDNITQTDVYPNIANFNNIRAYSPQRQDGISLTLLGDLDSTVAGEVMILDEFNFPGYDREADYPVPIYMTESGSIGQYISGHLTVPVRNKTDNSIHSAICIFRVKRRE